MIGRGFVRRSTVVLVGVLGCGVAISTAGAERDRVAVWLVQSPQVESSSRIVGFLVDRLGASGVYGVVDPRQSRSVGRAIRYDQGSVFDAERTTAFSRAVGARWVLWVKAVDRSVSSKKLLSIPHLFSHRRPELHLFFDCRIWDADALQMVASRRVKLSREGEGSIQVAEDERADPIYNNDAVEFHERFRQLDWEAAGRIAAWFTGQTAGRPTATATAVDVGSLEGPFEFDAQSSAGKD